MAVGAGMVATALVALAMGENASGEFVTSIRFSQKKTGETAVLPRRTVYSVIIQGRESGQRGGTMSLGMRMGMRMLR